MPPAALAAPLAWRTQAFALYQGQHQDMLDLMMYFLLAMATAFTSVVMLAEMALPEAFWLGCLKVFSMWLQVSAPASFPCCGVASCRPGPRRASSAPGRKRPA